MSTESRSGSLPLYSASLGVRFSSLLFVEEFFLNSGYGFLGWGFVDKILSSGFGLPRKVLKTGPEGEIP